MSEILLDTGSGEPKSNLAEFCVFVSGQDLGPESKIVNNRTPIRSHFSISAKAGVRVVIS